MAKTKRANHTAIPDSGTMLRRIRRKIAEWAEVWDECPRKQCRRNRTCCCPDDCRAMATAPRAAATAEDDAAWAEFLRLLQAKAGRHV